MLLVCLERFSCLSDLWGKASWDDRGTVLRIDPFRFSSQYHAAKDYLRRMHEAQTINGILCELRTVSSESLNLFLDIVLEQVAVSGLVTMC